MEVRYNVTGERRKELVQVISDITGARAFYQFMPTCNYIVDFFTITKDGTLIFDDRSDSEEVEIVLEGIAEAGFECEAAPGADSGDTAASAGDSGETPNEEPEAAQGADSGNTTAPAGNTGLTVSLPMDGFTANALDRLRKLVGSKAKLIRKALGAASLDIQTDAERVSFPWWDTMPEPQEAQAFTAFVAALCAMAKEAKRVTATEKEVESEKYVFRGFLLRLGFIGAGCKDQRKLLLKNLSGTSAFPNKEKADAFSAAQKAKRDAARATAYTATDTTADSNAKGVTA